MQAPPPPYDAHSPQGKDMYGPPQGAQGPPQGGYYPPGGQYPQGGYPPPGGYHPQPGAYYPPPQPMGYPAMAGPVQQQMVNNTVVVTQGAPSTVIVEQREKVNHVLHCIISFFFWPWVIVWICLCICYGC